MVLKKTKTIKERLVYVYLPSENMVENWKGLAKEAGTSLSKFVIEHVENGIRKEENDFVSRVDLITQVRQLGEENDRLRKENKNLGIVIDKLTEDLQIYRLKPFLSEQFEGIRQYEKTLTKAFRRKGFIKTDELWHEIGINPRNTNVVKAVTIQLEHLEQYGIIKRTREGWRWMP